MDVTKRQTHAHLFVCVGCCCGRTDKGRPEVPVDHLKAEWKRRGLLKHVQLTISGCLGPCDLVNVVAVAGSDGIDYVGSLTTLADFDLLIEWAAACAEAGRQVALPDALAGRCIDRFRAPVDAPVGAATALSAAR